MTQQALTPPVGPRPWLKWSSTVAMTLIVLAGLATFKVLQIQAAIAYGESFPELSETVRAANAQAQPWQGYTRTLGTVLAPRQLVLSAEVGGRILSVPVRSGERVAAGAVLVELDASEEQARLAGAEANATLARLALQRQEKLRRHNTSSQEDYDQAKAQLASLAAEVRTLQAQIDKKTLRAPFAATVGLHTLEPGQLLQAGQSLTTLVGDTGFVWVDFSLPAGQTRLQTGDRVQIEVSPQGTSSEPTTPEPKTWPGRIEAIQNLADANSRSLTYRSRVEASLIANTTVTVAIPQGATADKVVVPKTALKRDPFGTYVFTLVDAKAAPTGSPANGGRATPEGAYRARMHPVTLGEERSDVVVIDSGLEPGAFIAIEGAYKLAEDTLVYVKSDAPATQPAEH